MEKDERFRAKFDQVDIGYALIESSTGILIKVNKKFCDIVGIEKDAAEGSLFMDITHPDDVQENLHKMQKLMQGGLDEFTMELRYMREDGSQVFCNLTIVSLSGTDESPTYHLVCVEDITERKGAENQLKKINDLLGQRVQDLTVELETKTSELEATRKLLNEDVAKLAAEKQQKHPKR